MRLFIAINFSTDTRNRLLALRNELHSKSKRGNFCVPENLHLTLAFLGECDGKQTAAVKAVIDTLSFASFDVTVDSVGRFKRDNGDIWWAGLAESKPLIDLQKELTGKLISTGFKFEGRKYSPHITLGREVVTASNSIPLAPFSETVTGIQLMKSEHINGKLTYTSIHLKGASI